MTIQNLDFGTPADDDGETLKTAFPKVQANFEDLDGRVVDLDGRVVAIENAPAPITDYNDLTNKPTLGTAASQNTGTSGANVPLLNGANTWGSQQTFGAMLNLSSGQIAFPATQIPSANANTLDDYEEGTWTPVLTFATPGDLAVTYHANRFGTYTKIGRAVAFSVSVIATAFTHSTASGQFLLAGFPFACVNTFDGAGAVLVSGYTKSGYSSALFEYKPNDTAMYVLVANGGPAMTELFVADMTSGSNKRLQGAGIYSTV